MVESIIRNPDALTCFAQLKKKDEYTAQHSMRVCILALSLGRHLGLEKQELNTLGLGALLHDLGKMKVPNEILNKPGPLNDYEYALMKSHVPRGVEILDNTSGIPRAAIEVARCHHERYSGSGYIHGLKGDQIGLFGMIGGIVDCYDAISSDRAYHTGMSAHAALKKMYEWRNRDFHPGLVEQFIQCMGIYPIGSVVELNTGEVCVVVTMNRMRRLKPRVALVLQSDYYPVPGATTVDLMNYNTGDGRACEIERVLESGAYGINPVQYLPVTAAI
jgi:putative nucleotidyltransferase with HDIG domain